MAAGNKLTPQQALEAHQLRFAKKGLGWGILSGATWGLQGVLITIAGYMAPFYLDSYALGLILVGALCTAAMHDLFAGGWVALYNIFTGRGAEYLRSLKTRPGKIVLLAAIFGGPIGMGGYIIAVNLCGATYALAISAMYPAVGALLGWLILKEKITPRVWFGIACCMVGAFIVGYTPPQGGLEAYPYFYLGIAFALCPVIGWASEGVISTFGMDMVDSDIALGMRELFSGVMLFIIVLPIAGMLAGAGLSGWTIFAGAIGAFTPMMWVAIAGISGGLSYVAWYKALNMTGVGRAMAFNVTYALWSIPFGLLFAKMGLYTYSVTSQAIIGAVIITFGTILVVANPRELLKLRN
ncbi:DMT family transporter [Dehalobacterium formicoaceticum]|uniref:DMT family transporter n=1 Tax=Dehalobacterium formicoaceticum TaxID=51515 RepID=A0ABT1Y1N9_9FIRM|nr:DMT family transporter [Dehalobacterium formicoaceticum]MCR6544787.1 DMT family transporter [Dehalobacterium formicoaceticum]